MRHEDGGFTLIEMLIGIMITAIILTTLTASFLVFTRNASDIGGRDNLSAGAEVISSFLNRDLASATNTSATSWAASKPSSCTSVSTPVLTLTWTTYSRAGDNAAPDADPVADASPYKVVYAILRDTDPAAIPGACMLQRQYTPPAGSPDTATTTVLAHDLKAAAFWQGPSSTCASGNQISASMAKFTGTNVVDNSPDYTYSGCTKARTNAI